MKKEEVKIFCDCCGEELNKNSNYYIITSVRMAADQEVEKSELDICADCISDFTFKVGMDGLEACKDEEPVEVYHKPAYSHMSAHKKGQRYSI